MRCFFTFCLVLATGLFGTMVQAGALVVSAPGAVPAAAIQVLALDQKTLESQFHQLDQLPWQALPNRLSDFEEAGRLMRFQIELSTAPKEHLSIVAWGALVTNATFYLVKDGQLLQRSRFGVDVDVSERPIAAAENVVPLALAGAGRYHLIIAASNRTQQRIISDLELISTETLAFEKIPRRTALAALLVGVQSVFFLFVLLLLAWRSQTEFFYAAAFIFGGLWLTLVREGLLYPLFGWSSEWFADHSRMAGICCVLAGATLYLCEKLRPSNKLISVYVWSSGWLMSLCTLLFLFFDLSGTVGFGLIYVNAYAVLLVLVVVAICRAVKGGVQARLFAAVWLFFLLLLNLGLIVVFLPDASAVAYHNRWGWGVAIVSVWLFSEYLWNIYRDALVQQEAKSAAASRIEMVSRLSHEIRTPLNAVIGLADLLLAKRDPEVTRSYAGMIRSAGQTLLDLVNNILDFSKLNGQESALESKPFRLDQMLSSMLTDLFDQIKSAGVVPTVRIEPGVPFFLMGDAVRVKQVFTCLIANGLKAVASDGKVDVLIRCGETDQGMVQLKCEVNDDGRGLSQLEKQEIFQPMLQTSVSDKGRFKESGLGFAITKMLVDSMGGSIQVISDKGHGASFSFDLWLGVNPDAPDLAEQFSPLSGQKIALVSAIALNSVLVPMLEQYGAQVKELPALDQLDINEPFDLLITESAFALKEPCVDWLAAVSKLYPVVIFDPEPTPRAWLQQLKMRQVYVVSLPNPVLSSLSVIVSALGADVAGFLNDDKGLQDGMVSEHHVLVVDDNALNLMVCGKVLESLGIVHEEVQSGREALEKMEQGNFTLVLLDCEMPDMDGYEVARNIRATEKAAGAAAIPIIALTAHTLAEVQDRCLAAGMNAVEHKPVSRQKLADVIGRYTCVAGS